MHACVVALHEVSEKAMRETEFALTRCQRVFEKELVDPTRDLHVRMSLQDHE